MSQERIPKRNELNPKDTWATEDLFVSDEAWLTEFANCSDIPEKIAAYKGTLGESAENLLAWLKFCDEVNLRLSRLASYAHLKADEDSAVSKYQDFRGKIAGLLTKVGAASAFEEPEIMAISQEKLEQFRKEEPGLAMYDRYLYKMLRRKEHVLSEAEERILASAGEVCDSPDLIGSTFRNADLKFPDAVDSEGKSHALTAGSYASLLQSPDRVLRESAFKNTYHTYEQFRNTVAAILNAQMKQLIFNARTRKFDSSLEAALFRNEVPVSVYHNLIEAVHANMDTLHRYMDLRKRLMGVDELHMYDIYVPLVTESDQEITFEQAKETVLEGLAVLGEDYLDVLREGFTHRWIDVYENEGKRSGAYSSGARPHPYVLLNHKNTLDSQFTLAHEMGHALHSYFSKKTQPVVNSQYVIFVAEVASTCNEVLLMKHLLGKTEDKQERAYLINYFLEQFRTTLYRQTQFAEFEMMMSQKAEAGEELTADLLCDMYYQLNREYYGENMAEDREIAIEWGRVPHFFYDFYVFQYATGFSAAVAIANRILEKGEEAVKDYRTFLSSGGSQDPISLLKIAGVDMTTAQPVNDALKLFDELISEMESLMEEK
ncbi:MAG: oligoendopeptidase F [Lachnospirales bacterium]